MRNPNCRDCELWRSSKTVCVEGDGPRDAKVMVIGEAPGEAEARTGKPFMGKSGQLLRAELARAGLTSVFITNVARCRPPENRTPTNDELKACRKYLDSEIEEINPEYIITLGSTASKAVLRKSKITADHGMFVRSEKVDYIGMPAFHPAYALRDPSKLPALRQDLERLAREMKGENVKKDIVWDVVNKGTIDRFFEEFEAAEEFSFDTETSGLFMHGPGFRVRCLGIGLQEKTWIIPLDMPGSPFPKPSTRVKLISILAELASSKRTFAANGKFDNQCLLAVYGKYFHLNFDVGLAHHLIDENTPNGLKEMARNYLDVDYYDMPLAEKLSDEDPPKIWKYCAYDCRYTFDLAHFFDRTFKKDPSLRKLFYRLVMPASRAMTFAEMNGFTIDMPKFKSTEEELRTRIARLEKELRKMAGEEINWNSPAQVGKLLFGKFGLVPTVMTDGGAPSTGEEALYAIKDEHPIANTLVQYREATKFLSTYIEGWKEFMVGDKLYLSTKLHGTVTGRWSSRLHQVPRDGTIRNLVKAPEEWTFVQADLSQAEVRIAAELSRDTELITCFRRNIDVHWRTLMNNIESGGEGEYAQAAIETAKLYCLSQELPPNRKSATILSALWKENKDRKWTAELLEKCRKEWKDQEAWRRFWGKSTGTKQSILEGWRSSDGEETNKEDLLQAVQEYQEFRYSSQGRKRVEQPLIELDSALSILSSIGPSVAQKLWSHWKEARKKAKGTVFGFLYGMGAPKFIEYAKLKYDFEPSIEEATQLRDSFFHLYHALPAWHNRQRKLVRLDGQVRSLIGRVRRLPGAHSTDRSLVSEAERQAINSPVQGLIGDIKAMALVEIDESFTRWELKILGEVHDSILLQVRTSELERVLPKVRQIMRAPKLLAEFGVKLTVPLEADLELGNWGAGRAFTNDR